MNSCGTDMKATEVCHLVFHERDEWGDDDAYTLHCQCWNLERNRLSASRWHQSECVMTGTDTLDDVALYTPETVEAPVAFKY